MAKVRRSKKEVQRSGIGRMRENPDVRLRTAECGFGQSRFETRKAFMCSRPAAFDSRERLPDFSQKTLSIFASHPARFLQWRGCAYEQRSGAQINLRHRFEIVEADSRGMVG